MLSLLKKLNLVLVIYFWTFLTLVQNCVFTKNFSDAALHVYWTGPLRIYNCNKGYFTFNGAECSAPLPIDGIVYMAEGSGKYLHRVCHIEGHCNGIPRCAWDSGSVIVSVIRLPTLTRDTFQCPGSLSKKFLKLRISFQRKVVLSHVKSFNKRCRIIVKFSLI